MKFHQQKNEIITIFGKKGQGKTAITKLLTFQELKPSIIIDPLKQFTSGLIFHSPDALWEYLREPTTRAEFFARNQRLILHYFDDSKAGLAKKEALYGNLVKYIKNFLLIVDEIDMHFHSHANSKLSEIYKYGRNNNISIISTSKRPASVHNDCIEQTDIFILFKTATPDALNQVIKFWEDKEAREALKKLNHLEFMAYNTNKDTYTIEKIQDKHWHFINLI